MPRPLVVDVLRLLYPLAIGLVALVVGRWSLRWPGAVRYTLMALAAGVVVTVSVSLANLLPAAVDATVWAIGGATLLLSWAALFLLGAVWRVPAPGWRTRLFTLAALVGGGFILMDAGACLWWRLSAAPLWQRTADARGGLEQSTGWTCYPAAAVMYLHHYGIPASEGEMAYLANTTLFGTNEHVMARALTAKVRSRGWRAEVEEAGYDDCVRWGSPFIAHVEPPDIDDQHAIFVKEARPGYVLVIDPLDGVPRRMARARFEAMWDGTLVRFTSGP